MKSMNDINVIKPVKENEKKGIWDKIKNTSAVVATVAIMTTVGCSSKSEIEWTGDKDLNDQDYVELENVDEDELLDNEEENDVDEEDSDIIEIDMETEDEDLIDEEQDEIDEIQDEDLIDEEQDEVDEEIQDEDVIEPIPETIVTLELNVDENVNRVVAGEMIDINGMKFEVKYDNNDGSIYLMNDEEIVRVEWDQSNNANGAEVSVKDRWVNKTYFDTRILYKVTDVTNEKVWEFIGNENDVTAGVENTQNGLNYIFIETLHNEDWDSGSRTIMSLEAKVDGVETKVHDFMVMENEGKQVGNYYIEPTYSANLYNGENTIVMLEIETENNKVNRVFPEKEEYDIIVDDQNIRISVRNTFYNEKENKWYTQVYADSNFIRTAEQDKPLEYDKYTITVKEGTFITE